MCAAPAASNPFRLYLHRATMSGLAPGARYRYRVAGDGAARPMRAQPAPGPGQAFSFVAFGDMGESSHASSKSPG
jgi:phosphodiesterase/alkaline phosphatase D-like protein